MQDTIIPFYLPVIMNHTLTVTHQLILSCPLLYFGRVALSVMSSKVFSLRATSSSIFGARPRAHARRPQGVLGLSTFPPGIAWKGGLGMALLLFSRSREPLSGALSHMHTDHSACNLAQSNGTIGLRTGRDSPPST
jgi:hypothetical protein